MAAIILDFDGTIADSFDYIAGFLAEQADKPPLGADEKAELRGRSMASIGRQFGHSWWRLLRLFFIGRRRMHKVMSRVRPFDGMPDVIEKLHAEGHELFILTSNTVANVHTFLHHYKLHPYFLEIYGGIGLFGKGPTLKRLIKEQNLEKKDVAYVGDEERDIKAAHKSGIRMIAVTWGFARTADLAALRPTALAADPDELLAILEEI